MMECVAGRYVNMNAPMLADVTRPDYIEPWSPMNDSSDDEEPIPEESHE